ncbi:hypothetical protein [Xenorhabdus siamensis]|uniref:hypothetical protein n=1 Tax=Xenorhabdus siamensis TaxID=3136254 RepID=UPI0030F3C9C7
MLQILATQIPRLELTESIIAAKLAKNLSWKEIANGTGMNVAFVTAALFGQHPLPIEAAKKVVEQSGLTDDAIKLLQAAPMRGSIPTGVPTDPTIYRFYEMLLLHLPSCRFVGCAH